MMLKIVSLLVFSAMYCIAFANKVVVLNEDFSWHNYGSIYGWTTTGETRIDKWTAAECAHGWTSKSTWCYARPGFLKLSKTSYGGDVCSPFLTNVGSKPTTATLTFQATGWGTSGTPTDGRNLYVSIVGDGKITSVSGGGNTDEVDASWICTAYGVKGAAKITMADDNHFDSSIDPTALEIWKQEDTWYTLQLEGITSESRILFVAGNYNTTPTNRIYLDNIKVEADIDTTSTSMVVFKKNGSVMAVYNEDIDSVKFLRSFAVNKDAYTPDTVYTPISNDLPAASVAYNYVGSRISFDEVLDYTYIQTANNGVAHQSSAAYGDYLFMVKDKLAAIYMYNLKTNKMVCSCSLTPHSETISSSSSTVMYHCNQSSFGTLKYAETDDFPVLYISQRAPSSTQRCLINVLRIIPVKNSAGTEYTSFTIQEVQTIQLPAATDNNAIGNANFTVDPQTGDFYSYSRNNNSSASNYLNCRITKYPKADLSQTEVIFNDNDILESYEIFYPHNSTNISALNMQGAFIWNKKLYISQGYPSCKFINLHVVDLSTKKAITYIDLLANGFPVEPEGCFFYNNHIMLSCNGAPIYTLYFK